MSKTSSVLLATTLISLMSLVLLIIEGYGSHTAHEYCVAEDLSVVPCNYYDQETDTFTYQQEK